jgi:hypothetical protein
VEGTQRSTAGPGVSLVSMSVWLLARSLSTEKRDGRCGKDEKMWSWSVEDTSLSSITKHSARGRICIVDRSPVMHPQARTQLKRTGLWRDFDHACSWAKRIKVLAGIFGQREGTGRDTSLISWHLCLTAVVQTRKVDRSINQPGGTPQVPPLVTKCSNVLQ